MTISRMQQPRQMYQEGGIMPRLNQLGSGVSSAEQMLQGINQRLESAESSLGSGGGFGTLASSVQTPDPFFGKNPLGADNPLGGITTFDGRILGPGKIDNQGQDPLQIGKLGQIPEQFRSGFDEYLKNNETSFGFGGQALSSVGLPGGGSVTFGDTGSAGAFRDYLKSTGFNPSSPLGQPLGGLGGGMGSPISSAMRNMAAGGGMMGRQMYGLGSLVKSITKPFKKVAKGVKKFAKSDLGKAALLIGTGMYAGGLGPFSASGMFSSVPGRGFLRNIAIPNFLKTEGSKKFFGKIGDVALDVGVGSLVAGGLDAFQRSKLPQPETRIMGRTEAELDEIEAELRKNYENLGYEPGEIDLLVEQGMKEYGRDMNAYGGRIGFSDGLGSFPMKKDGFLISPDFDKMTPEQKRLYEGTMSIYKKIQDKYKPSDEILKKLKIQQEIRKKQAEEMGLDPRISLMANGGRIGYARGDTAEQNAMQASGIMGLPLNENPAGVTELDLRETGGFIPPVGVKEKADDIPAMLSNNEFVFTADAVRGMGDGDVNRGAERMYSMMKQLENGGRV